MYENFTDRARAVMRLANQEAQRFNHKYIGTDHILIGLIKEGTGVAANVLKYLDLDLRKIRLEVEKLVQRGTEMVQMGKLPITPRAKKAIEYSMEEARSLNHNFVGTEHLLLGLMRGDNVAIQVVENLGVTPDSIIKDIHHLLGNGEGVADQPPKTATIRIVHVNSHDGMHEELHSVVELSEGVFFHVNSDNLIVFSQSDGKEYFINVNHMIGLSVTPDKAVEPNGDVTND